MDSRFAQRSHEIEIMDDLQCSGEVVYQTLRELEFINRWLGGNAVTLEGVRQMVQAHESKKLTIADLGCGGGDMLKLLADWGRAQHLNLQLVGIDANPNIIEFAKRNCSEYPEISFETLDIFSPLFLQKSYDIIMGTLFYHHFQNEVLIEVLSKLKHQARIGLLINDIHRHWLAYHSIRILTKLFSRSAMVKVDAPLSVLRAFTQPELRMIMEKAGMATSRLKWKWAFRWLVSYQHG